MNKFAAFLLALIMCLSLAACGGGEKAEDVEKDIKEDFEEVKEEVEEKAEEAKEDVEEKAEEVEEEVEEKAEEIKEDVEEEVEEIKEDLEDKEDIRVAMITDYGDITDESFNQFTYEACKKFADEHGLDEDGFKYYKPDDDATEARVAMIDKAIADGYNVLVLPGFAFGEAIAETAELYPDVKYVALDVSEYDLETALGHEFDLDNVYSAVYAEELAGYMAGYCAASMGYTKLGYLGGMAVPSVVRYGHGFVQAISDVAAEKDIEVEVVYAYGNQFWGDADITAVMDTWCKDGTEVIFAAGGAIYTSACEALEKTDGKVIGVDVDQAPIIDKKYGEERTLTSAMKGLGVTVDTLLTAIEEGNWDDYKGQIATLGLVSDKPEENFVQLPESTLWNDDFSKDDYAELVKKMNSGEIEVDNSIDNEEPTVFDEAHVTLDYQGNIK